jgi:hypothetical protein
MAFRTAIDLQVTATTILLSWGTPFDSGGVAIVDYELSYTEIVPRDDLSTTGGSEFKKGDVQRLEETHRKFRLGEATEEFLMIDLRGDNDYKNIRLVAVNEADLESEAAHIPLVHTKPPSWRQRLVKEIQRVRNINKGSGQASSVFRLIRCLVRR